MARSFLRRFAWLPLLPAAAWAQRPAGAPADLPPRQALAETVAAATRPAPAAAETP
ncbi:hypothetical protein [Hymenobacter coccineus]|uniref:hypothetical protein n=1 Tax=Hymenobacter coccineus TaxID=1908235 RepID=UPI0013010ADD|nr:hypothetical protein [Hymenobacter coccineus]